MLNTINHKLVIFGTGSGKGCFWGNLRIERVFCLVLSYGIVLFGTCLGLCVWVDACISFRIGRFGDLKLLPMLGWRYRYYHLFGFENRDEWMEGLYILNRYTYIYIDKSNILDFCKKRIKSLCESMDLHFPNCYSNQDRDWSGNWEVWVWMVEFGNDVLFSFGLENLLKHNTSIIYTMYNEYVTR